MPMAIYFIILKYLYFFNKNLIILQAQESIFLLFNPCYSATYKISQSILKALTKQNIKFKIFQYT